MLGISRNQCTLRLDGDGSNQCIRQAETVRERKIFKKRQRIKGNRFRNRQYRLKTGLEKFLKAQQFRSALGTYVSFHHSNDSYEAFRARCCVEFFLGPTHPSKEVNHYISIKDAHRDQVCSRNSEAQWRLSLISLRLRQIPNKLISTFFRTLFLWRGNRVTTTFSLGGSPAGLSRITLLPFTLPVNLIGPITTLIISISPQTEAVNKKGRSGRKSWRGYLTI